MVTPSDTSTPAATPVPAPGKKWSGPKGGGKGAAKDGGKRNFTIVAINRRVEALQKLEDAEKKKKARRRLLHNVLTGIADGSVKQPNKAAEAVLKLMPKGGGKAAAAEED